MAGLLSDVNAILAWHIHSSGKENCGDGARWTGSWEERKRATRGKAEAGAGEDNDEGVARPERGEETSTVGEGRFFVEDASLVTQLRLFVEVNKLPDTSPNLTSEAGDDISLLLEAARRVSRARAPGCDGEGPHAVDVLCFAHLCCAALKILSRKQANRAAFGRDGVRAVIALLTSCNESVARAEAAASSSSDGPTTSRGRALPSSAAAACGEAANIILNVCYEKKNVEYVLDADGVAQLLVLARHGDAELQANAAGAMQSICYQRSGRRSVVASGGVPALLDLIGHDDLKVRSRAIGALHNLSSDAEAIKIIRRRGGIEKVIALLGLVVHRHDVDVVAAAAAIDELPLRNAIASSAAGTLQNVCREVASRDIVSEHEHAVHMLTEVLFGDDVHAQVCAAGALINIIGPELERSDENTKSNLDALRRASGRRRPLRRTSDAGFYPTYKVDSESPTSDMGNSPAPKGRTDRHGFSRLLKCCLTLAMLRSAIFDAADGSSSTAPASV